MKYATAESGYRRARPVWAEPNTHRGRVFVDVVSAQVNSRSVALLGMSADEADALAKGLRAAVRKLRGAR